MAQTREKRQGILMTRYLIQREMQRPCCVGPWDLAEGGRLPMEPHRALSVWCLGPAAHAGLFSLSPSELTWIQPHGVAKTEAGCQHPMHKQS